jgi:hypothetical protein
MTFTKTDPSGVKCQNAPGAIYNLTADVFGSPWAKALGPQVDILNGYSEDQGASQTEIPYRLNARCGTILIDSF